MFESINMKISRKADAKLHFAVVPYAYPDSLRLVKGLVHFRVNFNETNVG